MTKGKKITIWILAIVLAVIVGTVGTVYFYGNHLFNKLEKVEIDKEDIGISHSVVFLLKEALGKDFTVATTSLSYSKDI